MRNTISIYKSVGWLAGRSTRTTIENIGLGNNMYQKYNVTLCTYRYTAYVVVF